MVSFKTVLWSLPFFLTLPDSSGWDWEGTGDYSASPSGKAFPCSVAGSPCRQAVSFYGVLVSLRQAISFTKRFSNSTAFVKWKNQTLLSCKITVTNDLWKVREGDVQDLSLDLLLGRTIKGSSISGGGWYPYRNVFQCLITFCNWERGFPLFNLNLSYNCSYLLQFFCVLWTWIKVFTLYLKALSMFPSCPLLSPLLPALGKGESAGSEVYTPVLFLLWKVPILWDNY